MDYDKEIEWKESCIEALENCKAKLDKEIEKLIQEKGEIASQRIIDRANLKLGRI